MIKKEKSLLLPIIILALVILSGIFLLKPKIVNILEARRTINQNKQTLATLTKKVATLEGLSKPELTDKVDLVLKILPSEKDVPQTMFVIKKVALNNGLVVSELDMPEVGEIASGSATPAKTDNKEVLPSLSVNLTLSGGRLQIINFLKQIETTSPLMKVSGLVINQKGEGLDEAMINIKSYYLSFPKTIGKFEQQITPVTTQEEKIFDKIYNFSLISEEEMATPSALPAGGKSNLFSY